MIKAKWGKIEFDVGDVVRVDYVIKEKGKERTQPFQGRIIKIRGRGESKTITIRKIAVDQVGVERVIPLNSPWIKNLKVLSKPKKRPRRSKLYYLRDIKGKKAKI